MATKEIKRIIEVSTGRSNATIRELRDIVTQGKKAMQDLEITSVEFAEVSEDVANAQNLLRNAMRGTTAAVEGSYNAYSAEMSALKLHRKTLAENSEEYKVMTARIVELNTKLSAMDAEIGVYGRNVGNYSSAFAGLNLNVSQVVRELPSLTMGADQFFLAISNNLPMLVDSMGAVRREGGSVMSVISGIGKSLFSWNTVITLIITLLSAFSGDIIRWVKGLFSAEKQLNATAMAQKALNDAIKDNGLGIGDDMIKLRQLREAWSELGDDMSAKQEFIEENRSAFNDLGVAVQSVADAQRLLIDDTEEFEKAMIARAKATAAMNLAVASSEKVLSLQQQLDNTTMLESGTRWGFNEYGVFERQSYTEMTKEYRTISEALQKARDEAEKFYEMMSSFQVEANNFLSAFSTSTTTTPDGKMTFAPRTTLGTAELDVIFNALRTMPNVTSDWALGYYRPAPKRDNRSALEILQDEEVRLNDQLAMYFDNAEKRMEIEDALTANLEKQAKLRMEAEKKEAKESERLLRERQRAQEAYLSASAQIVGAVGSIMEDGTKAQKGFATAEALINTYAAAQKIFSAYAGVPIPGFAWAQMAAAIATGLANVKAIWDVDTSGNASPSASVANGVPPSIASTMPANYTRNLVGDSELTELNRPVKAYVVQSEVTAEQDINRQREESASF